MLVHDVLRDAARTHGSRVAVEGSDGTRSFLELYERAARLSAGLLSLGLRPGDRVLEAIPNSCALLESDFALALAGLVRVPLNPRLGPHEWRAVAADSGARALLLDPSIRTADDARIDQQVPVELLVRVGEQRTPIAPSGTGGAVASTAELLAGSAAVPTVGDGTAPQGTIGPDTLVGLAYSSGTTGRPKGARRTHRMRLTSAEAMAVHVVGDTLDAEARYLHAGPAIHTSGLFVLPMLRAGVPQLMLDHARPEQIVQAIRDRQITHLAIVPTVVAALTETVGRTGPLTSLRMLAYAGAPMPAAQLRAAHDRLTPQLVQYYGLVEAMPPLTVLTAADHAEAMSTRPPLLGSAGRVLPSVDLRILDEEDGTGEIAVRGDVVSTGYWNAEARSDLGKSFRDGWLRTGDVGRLQDGYLWITDRRSDMIISGGYNIYPREVEDVVASVPGVAGCAAVGLPDPTWGQRLVVAYRGDGQVTPESLREACRTLAPHKRPKAFVALADLPLGATGKIDRRAVARLLAE